MSLDIILVNHKRGQTRRFKLSWREVHLWLPVAALSAVLLSASFWLGQRSAEGPRIVMPPELGKSWQREMTRQRAQISDVRTQLDHNMLALYQRLGRLQAHVARLNAVGQRITEMARMTPGEFNFDQEPALGGPAELTLLGEDDRSIAEFERQLEQFTANLDAREREMRVLQDLVVAGRLREQIYPSGRPVVGGYITSGFGRRSDPFSGRRAFHKGVDFAGRHGSPVLAVAAGVVTWTGDKGGYGNLIEINHGNGYITRYGHNSKILAKVGDKISKGQAVARMGSTGRSTGPHVHFEVLHNDVVVNPAEYIRASAR